MKTESKVLLAILALTVLILFGGVFILGKNSTQTNSSQVDKEIEQINYSLGQKVGSDSAKVKLVEFSDFQCPACKAFEPQVEQLLSDTKDKDFQFVYRHFPLPQHKNAKQAAVFAEAAAEQGQFWPIHDLLFKTQEEWTNLSNPTDYFIKMAEGLNLDVEKLKQSMSESKLKDRVEQDISEGVGLRINSTPTFYINGRKLELQKLADLNFLVEQELKSNP
ncbi:thioredoxin domain-containing protein [Candidatus Daviesbacteria bacterium]|nr:thioredoxin domain-containing protein [Candidatus Daviesbacteria bacterium]